MMFKPTLRALCGVMAALLAGVAFGVMAQTVKMPAGQRPAIQRAQPAEQSATPPAGLQWKWMDVFYFNSKNHNFKDEGIPEEKELLSKIWANEIKNLKDPATHTNILATALIGSIEHQGTNVMLTMFDNSFLSCDPPGNGKGMVDMYSTCPLRVVRHFQDGQSAVLDLSKIFCVLDINFDSTTPRPENHTEYGFDERTGIVYLRTIQYGKVVPACNRALRIFEVQ